MLLSQWYFLAGVAFVLTIVWAVVLPDERVFVSAGLAFLAWALAALTAPGVQTVSNGEMIAAGSPVLAFLSLAFATVSGIAVLGYKTGLYPPSPADEPPFPADKQS